MESMLVKGKGKETFDALVGTLTTGRSKDNETYEGMLRLGKGVKALEDKGKSKGPQDTGATINTHMAVSNDSNDEGGDEDSEAVGSESHTCDERASPAAATAVSLESCILLKAKGYEAPLKLWMFTPPWTNRALARPSGFAGAFFGRRQARCT